ncbi:hypothetical protein T492DRAFT_409871 [Pavlovales sp. CCMP2436]|nr:hypothetical protein T492DRAFT_409871 [Pavlovales sp. CCMP2436]
MQENGVEWASSLLATAPTPPPHHIEAVRAPWSEPTGYSPVEATIIVHADDAPGAAAVPDVLAVNEAALALHSLHSLGRGGVYGGLASRPCSQGGGCNLQDLHQAGAIEPRQVHFSIRLPEATLVLHRQIGETTLPIKLRAAVLGTASAPTARARPGTLMERGLSSGPSGIKSSGGGGGGNLARSRLVSGLCQTEGAAKFGTRERAAKTEGAAKSGTREQSLDFERIDSGQLLLVPAPFLRIGERGAWPALMAMEKDPSFGGHSGDAAVASAHAAARGAWPGGRHALHTPAPAASAWLGTGPGSAMDRGPSFEASAARTVACAGPGPLEKGLSFGEVGTGAVGTGGGTAGSTPASSVVACILTAGGQVRSPAAESVGAGSRGSAQPGRQDELRAAQQLTGAP